MVFHGKTRRNRNNSNSGKPLIADAYVITMNVDSERYKQTDASAKAANLPVKKWDAVKVDESMRDSLMEQGIGSMIFKGATMRHRGAIGCFLAHRGVMRHIAEQASHTTQGTLILEDDVKIPPDFLQKIQSIVSELPRDWDVLYLDKVNPKSEKVTEHIFKFKKQMTTSNNWGNWAYIVRNSSLKGRILPLLEFMIEPIDIQLHKFADYLHIYQTVPSLITLNEATTKNSNINKLNMNGGTRRKRQRKQQKKRQRGGDSSGGDSKCIFVNWGPGLGLGNQLCIYAAGLIAKKKTGKSLCIFPQVGNIHSSVDYRPMLKEVTSVERTPDMLSRLEAATKIHAGKEVQHGAWNEEDIPMVDGDLRLKDSKTPGYSGGYYQNYNSIKSVIPEIRDNLVPQLAAKYSDMIVKPNAAFMHIRRGDLIHTNEEVKPEYIRAALSRLEDVPEIQVIYYIMKSEEVDWTKGQKFQTGKGIEWFTEADELKAIYLMSQCKAGAILSASTFSMWGTYLGADSNSSSTIIYPKKWSPPMPNIDLEFPDRWIAI